MSQEDRNGRQTYGDFNTNLIFYVCKKKFRSDPGTKQILESMRSGAINIKQAAEALGMEPAMLAYQLAGRVSRKMSQNATPGVNG